MTAPPAPQLNAQLGSPEWQQALNQQVLMFHRNGQQSAELHLHPQELGALQITLKLDDQQAQLHIASAHGGACGGRSGDAAAAARAGGERYQHGAEQRGRRVHPAMAAAGATAGFQRRGRSSYAEHHGGDGAAAEGVSAPAALQRMASAVNGVDIFA